MRKTPSPGSQIAFESDLGSAFEPTPAVACADSANEHRDRFLELNLTDEKLVFTRIDGPIPNRGLAMPDINMFGVTYMQQINEANQPAKGLHIEPGIWANVPQTSDPTEPPTVVRMASIPHGTVINAQGVWQVIAGGPQHIPDNNILPFFFGQPPPANSDFHSVALQFSELDLSIPTQFRQLPSGVTQQVLQDMVKNPNSVLQQALQTSLQGTSMKSRTFLNISTTNSIIKGGGGTANMLSWRPATILLKATPGPLTSRRRSGSRPSRGRAATLTSISCNTRSW